MQNESGLRPVEYKVVIRPDPVEEKIGSVLLPDDTREKQGWAQVKGTLIAVGGKAFSDPFTDEERKLFQPGARVYFSKYEGQVFYGPDGEEYRLCLDKNIGGIVENEAAVPLHSIRARNRKGLDAA